MLQKILFCSRNSAMALYISDGNIDNKSGLGSFSYHADHPHAVEWIDNAEGVVSEEEQNITYTAFNKVSTITEGDYKLEIIYGPDNQRKKTVLYRDANSPAPLKSAQEQINWVPYKTKYYVGGIYEKEIVDALTDNTSEINYVYGGDGLAALFVKDNSGENLYYIHKDHLGSYQAVSDETGALQEELYFNAWGNRGSATTWSYPASQNDGFYGRGFTGHEHLPEFNLINMNGRVYDPILGRFLSPDNYVQLPDYTQSLNRYSYALNNPLKYTDPSGELLWIIPNIGWSKGGGLNIGISAVFGIPGSVLSAQAGANYSFGSNDFSIYRGVSALGNTAYWSLSMQSGFNVGYAFGATPYSGLPLSTNFLSAGVNYNLTHNSWSGNVSAWQVGKGGWTFNPSVSAMVFPEQTTNLVRGQGFRSNNQVLGNFASANNYQGALDYWGFKGTYMPDHPLLNGTEPGVTDPNTGDIFYNTSAFLGTFDKLYLTSDHELWHHKRVVSKKFERSGNTVGQEEYLNYMRNYRRQGLYKKHGFPIEENINAYGSVLNLPVEKYMPYSQYQSPFWHNLFKIRRLW